MELHHILVPVDFSEPSIRALRLAVAFARYSGARVHLLHVGVAPHFYATELGLGAPMGAAFAEMTAKVADEQEQKLRELAATEIPDAHRGEVWIREGFPPEEILAVVEEERPDLVVMGTHGRTGIKRALLGSVTERVVRQCPVPCTVTH